MSVSGGFGQVYETLFLLVARFRGMRVYLHHHSSAYLDRPKHLTRVLIKAAGPNAVHIIQSRGLAERLRLIYGVAHAIPVSNAVFFLPGNMEISIHSRQTLRSLGFLSNISQEKGVLDYLDLMEEIQSRGIPVRGELAGPFMDVQVEQLVRERLGHLHAVDYVGPKYGLEKDAFYDEIDAFVFPSRYANESEPLVLHEAMMGGLPVIAYGRGAIPEIVPPDCGLVIPPADPFLPLALEQIESWLADPSSFQAASCTTANQFERTRESSTLRWEKLLHAILGNKDNVAALASQSSGSA
jgi:glycosyltransferase involved in cell wall biosynthesis